VALARLHEDIAAASAVSARRAAARNELLAAEGHTAIAAVAGFHLNFRFVDKHKNEFAETTSSQKK